MILLLCTLLFTYCFTFSTDVSTFALIIDTSRTWTNYRHFCNALFIYQLLDLHKDHVIFIAADEYLTDPKFRRHLSLDDIKFLPKVDYQQFEVTSSLIHDLFTNSTDSHLKKRIQPSDRLFIYITGHSGPNFLKIAGKDQMTSGQIGKLLCSLHQSDPHRELLVIFDTCHGASLFASIPCTLRNSVMISSSNMGEDSFSYEYDYNIGTHVSDKFTKNFFILLKKHPQLKLNDIKVLDKTKIGSTIVIKKTELDRNNWKFSDFFNNKD
ncbi:hypothetical protein P9112_012076 [Eukaryota sp. TZLM1-RC]